MIITFEVFDSNGNSIGEVTERRCAPFGANPYTMWKATSFVRGVVGGQFDTKEKAQEHLLSQARGRNDLFVAVKVEETVWPEFTAEENAHIPF